MSREELVKVFVINCLGIIGIKVLLMLCNSYYPGGGNATLLGWLAIKTAIKCLLAGLAMLNIASAVNYATSGDWWQKLFEEANLAVAIVTGCLFVGVGLAVSAAI